MVELKPCPFCGFKDLQVNTTEGSITCQVCKTVGPYTGLPIDDVADLWNRRARNREHLAEERKAERERCARWIDDVAQDAQEWEYPREQGELIAEALYKLARAMRAKQEGGVDG